jgi:ankyrin repeat protein
MANGFQTLLKAGYNVRNNGFDKADALFWAIKYGHVDAVRFLIAKGADLGTKDNQDRSVVDLAIEYDQLAVLLALLESRPELFQERQYLETTVALLSQADQNFYSERMFSTMEVAAREGYTQIFRLLYNGIT